MTLHNFPHFWSKRYLDLHLTQIFFRAEMKYKESVQFFSGKYSSCLDCIPFSAWGNLRSVPLSPRAQNSFLYEYLSNPCCRWGVPCLSNQYWRTDSLGIKILTNDKAVSLPPEEKNTKKLFWLFPIYPTNHCCPCITMVWKWHQSFSVLRRLCPSISPPRSCCLLCCCLPHSSEQWGSQRKAAASIGCGSPCFA